VRRVLPFALAAPLLLLAAFVASSAGAGAASNPATTFGTAWSPALGAWLPDPDTGFDAWQKAQTSKTVQYDYFVCGKGNGAPSVAKQNFAYPGSACALFKSATPYVFGTAEPMKGNLVYDRAHAVVFYSRGCCAWRGFALAAGVKPPPKTVASADLGDVRTMRGVTLGMTPAQVERIYGPAKMHPVKGNRDLSALSYTTMKGTPTNGQGEACGQFQSFAFRSAKVVSIELLTGC
jgi:hypothetical protein